MDGRANADDGHDRGQEESASFEACIVAWTVMHRQIKAVYIPWQNFSPIFLVIFLPRINTGFKSEQMTKN